MNAVLKFLKSKLFIAILAILLAIGIAFVAVPYINQRTRDVTTVIRPNQNIPENTLIEDNMLMAVEVGSYGLPKGTLQTKEQLIGKYAKVALSPTDNLTVDKVKARQTLKDEELYALTESEKIAVSVSVKSLAASLSGKIQSGDIVSLYSVVADSASANSTASVILYPELKYLQVIAVTNAKANNIYLADDTGAAPTNTTASTQNDDIPATLTLLVTPEQAKRLILCDKTGDLHVALVGRGEDAAALLDIELPKEPDKITNAPETTQAPQAEMQYDDGTSLYAGAVESSKETIPSFGRTPETEMNTPVPAETPAE